MADFDQAVALHCDGQRRAEAFNNRGNAHYALGSLEAATDDYESAIAVFPDGNDKVAAYNNRGLVSAARGTMTQLSMTMKGRLRFCR